MLIPGLREIISISAGANHLVAIDEWGQVFTWGVSDQGQLGRSVSSIGNSFSFLNVIEESFTPMRVDLSSPADLVSCGDHHTLVLLETGQVVAFGLNNHGQLGLGASDFSNQMNTPQLVPIFNGESVQIQR